MTEIDSNLNYLLGRLSLVTQEFNQIKSGLGEALDNIRSSFHIVQNRIQGNVLNSIQNEKLTFIIFFFFNFCQRVLVRIRLSLRNKNRNSIYYRSVTLQQRNNS